MLKKKIITEAGILDKLGSALNSAKTSVNHALGRVNSFQDEDGAASSAEDIAKCLCNDCVSATATLYYMFEYLSKMTEDDVDVDSMGSRKLPGEAGANLDGLKKVMLNREDTLKTLVTLITHGKYDSVKSYIMDVYKNVAGYANRLKQMLSEATDTHASDLCGDVDKWLAGEKCSLFDPNDNSLKAIYDKVRTLLIKDGDSSVQYTYAHPERACTVFNEDELNEMVAAFKKCEKTGK